MCHFRKLASPALDQGEAVGQQGFFVLLLDATNQPKRAVT
jgi:hypothetical protein